MSKDDIDLLNAGLAFVGVVLAAVALWFAWHTWRKSSHKIELSAGIVLVGNEGGETQTVYQIVVRNKGRTSVSITNYGFVADGVSHAYQDPFFSKQVTVEPGHEERLTIPMERYVDGQPFVELGTGEKVLGHAPLQLKSFHVSATKPTVEEPSKAKDPTVLQIVNKGLELQKAGKNREAIALFDGAVSLSADATEAAQILSFTADSYYRLGEYAQAQTKGLAAIEKARAAGAHMEEGSAHCILGETAFKLGHLNAVVEYFEGGAHHFSRAGNENAAAKARDRLVQILGDASDSGSGRSGSRASIRRQGRRDRSAKH